MKRARNIVLAIAALGILAAAGLWLSNARRARELETLRTALDSAARAHETDRLALAQRIGLSETACATTRTTLAGLERELAAPRPAAEPPRPANPMTTRLATSLARIEALRQDPEYAEYWHATQRRAIVQRYGALFAQLQLPPDTLEKLKELLVEQSEISRDVRAALASQGVDSLSRDASRARTSALAEVAKQARELLGPEGYAAYREFNSSQSTRQTVGQFQLALADQGIERLSDAQFAAVTTAWSETRSPKKNPRFAEIGEEGAYGPAGNAMILERVAPQLSPAQQSTLATFLATQWEDLRAVAGAMITPIP